MVIVKVLTSFAHPLNDPVTVIVATSGLEVKLIPVTEGILPVPELPIDKSGLLFVQEIITLGFKGLLVKFKFGRGCPLHIVILFGAVIAKVGNVTITEALELTQFVAKFVITTL